MTGRAARLTAVFANPHMPGRLAWAGVAAAVLSLRVLIPPRGLDGRGLLALRDAALSLAHWVVVLLVAGALGLWLLRKLAPPDTTGLERLLFGFALGLGALAYLVLGVGLAGALYPSVLAAVTVGAAFVAAPAMGELTGSLAARIRGLAAWASTGKLLERISLAIALSVALLALIHTLGPAWDYDGLMYHLPGPVTFLDNHRVLPNLDIWYANGPFTIEMLFTLGLAYGDAVFAKLIHYALGWLYVAAAVMAGKRWLGDRGAWLSAVVLLGMPTLPIWAAFAYIDLGWATFEFLAACAIVRWWQDRSDRWLVLAGFMAGLGMGSKYTGVAGAAVLGLLLIALAWRRGVLHVLKSASAFAGLAILVASPWYLKNWLWFGNPVYPLYLGGPGWDAQRLDLYMAYLGSFGAGHEPIDWLLLPINLYLRNARFGAVMNQIDVPSLLFPLLLFYPLRRGPRPVTALLGFAAGRSVVWALASQQTRFLLPVFPALALATAHLALQLIRPGRRRMPWHIFLPGLAVGLSALTLFYQGVLHIQHRPLLPVAGWESSRQFLARAVHTFPAVDFINRSLSVDAHVLRIGDGRRYYCPAKCTVDPDHFRWAAQIVRLGDSRDLARWLATRGFSHLMVSWEDLDFLLQHDPTGTMYEAVMRLKEWTGNICFRRVYSDEWSVVIEIACH